MLFLHSWGARSFRPLLFANNAQIPPPPPESRSRKQKLLVAIAGVFLRGCCWSESEGGKGGARWCGRAAGARGRASSGPVTRGEGARCPSGGAWRSSQAASGKQPSSFTRTRPTREPEGPSSCLPLPNLCQPPSVACMLGRVGSLECLKQRLSVIDIAATLLLGRAWACVCVCGGGCMRLCV